MTHTDWMTLLETDHSPLVRLGLADWLEESGDAATAEAWRLLARKKWLPAFATDTYKNTENPTWMWFSTDNLIPRGPCWWYRRVWDTGGDYESATIPQTIYDQIGVAGSPTYHRVRGQGAILFDSRLLAERAFVAAASMILKYVT